MRTVAKFPHEIREIEHTEIVLPDGCRLAARIWLPADAEETPVPAILEYLPYRKNDLTAKRDASMHPYTAGHGYACVRVDMRGAGESDGVLHDEYLEQELRDGVDVIAWIAEQPWCDGNVGMKGISWGGFNGLQVAALQPPALKAVITLCSTDDRYADDVHYMGGCHLIENISWASIMLARNSLPPDPRLVGERWRDMWIERLKGSGLWLEHWLGHQRRDAFWQHGSVCEDIGRIECPVYAVGGWADGYTNTVFRLLESLEVPVKGLVGPWAHTYPHIGAPGPAIGWLQEELRWWDYWLKGRDTGIMDEPRLRAWMQEAVEPKTWYESRAGRWIAEPGWPSADIRWTPFALDAGGRLAGQGEDAAGGALAVSSPLSVGQHGGKWCSYALPGDQPADQNADDIGSLVFETAPLDAPMEILGAPVATLELESDKPVATVALRLSTVAPDGAATRFTYTVLNLTHRASHEAPEPLEPGKRYTVEIPLNNIGQQIPAGHRLRLSISTTYWPIVWPAPEPVTLTVHTGASSLRLPVRSARAEDETLQPFGEVEHAPALPVTEIEQPDAYWRVTHDLANDAHLVEIGDGYGTIRFDNIDLTLAMNGVERYGYSDGDYGSVTGEARWEAALSRGDWSMRTVTETTLISDRDNFRVVARMQAFEGDELAYEQSWDRTIPRDLV
mgnify:CR=1 FL=1